MVYAVKVVETKNCIRDKSDRLNDCTRSVHCPGKGIGVAQSCSAGGACT